MKIPRIVLFIAMVAAIGGLLFGFDTGVISGALPFLQEHWTLSDGQLEWLTTSVLLGAIIGAIASGGVTEMLGRKKMIIVNALIFFAASLGCAYASNVTELIVMRVIIGIAIGITSYVVPMYIAEISPKKYRGGLVTLNQLMITIGILASYITDYWLSNDQELESWRAMFMVGIYPAIALLTGMFFLPESPRWLISKNKLEKGRAILEKVESKDQAQQIIKDLQYDLTVSRNNSGLKELFKPWLRIPLSITVMIFFFQQFSGVNTIIYYSPTIFKMAGIVSNTASIIPAIIIGAANVAACAFSVIMLDRWGRRKLFLIGISGMIPSLAVLGISFHFGEQLGEMLPYYAAGSIIAFIIFIAISLAPLGWLLIAEIFPLRTRSLGMSVGSLAHWGFNAIVAFTFLKLVNTLGVAYTFWSYALVCVIGLLWGYFYIPETKGKSLEEIEDHWRQGKSARSL